MSVKFRRLYKMTVYPPQYLQTAPDKAISFTQSSGQTIEIENPFTLVFNIKRRAMASVNTANFQIYNLSQTTRNQLYKDYTNLLCLRRVTLRAGYESLGPLPIIFDGNIKWCTSYRNQGQTNFITEMEAFDWSFPVVNAHTTCSFSGSVRKQEVVDKLIKDLTAMGTDEHHVSRGFVHQYNDESNRPLTQYNRSLSGYSWDLLKDETQDSCFIDNGIINILDNDDCFAGSFNQISAETGLLGSPKRSETYVNAEMLFEPSLVVGQKVSLLTTSQKMFNGDYKIYGINHFGMISDAVSGKCQSNVSLFSFKKNAQLIQQTQSLV